MANNIFISYRRDDSAGYAGRLASHLASHFGPERVFMDVSNIGPGVEFELEIKRALATCNVLLAVIGKRWLQIADAQGRRRLEDPKDIVRLEIATALELGVRVIPILVDNAPLPNKTELPKKLAKLIKYNALPLSNAGWDFDVGRLIEQLAQLVPTAPTPPVPNRQQTRANAETNPQTSAVRDNPFAWRSGITEPAAFFNRTNEQRTLRDYLINQQNCQIVGPRRGGKTSLLRQVERQALEWCPAAKVAYLDLQDPRCATLKGWLRQLAKAFAWTQAPENLQEFADGIDSMRAQGARPVICLDEFGEMTAHSAEFNRDFLLTLRFCGQQGTSIITTARKRLSELTDPNDQSSPFFNTFPILRLGPFSPADAADYVSLYRPGVPPFTPAEKQAILEFAKGQPLALQVACFHVLSARGQGQSLVAALQRAEDDLKALLFSW